MIKFSLLLGLHTDRVLFGEWRLSERERNNEERKRGRVILQACILFRISPPPLPPSAVGEGIKGLENRKAEKGGKRVIWGKI